MLTIPKRITLVSQVVAGLRQGIETREWISQLPSEAELAALFQVSRITIRAAIRILREERLIEVRNGKRARVAANPPLISTRRPGIVGMVCPVFETGAFYAGYQNQYREILQKHGIETKSFAGLRYYRQGGSFAALAELISNTEVDLWVFTGSSPSMQDWFAANRVPVILDGSCISDHPLPALDVDNRGILRHAVGVLLGLGHRRITFLTVRSTQGGDFAAAGGFWDGFKAAPDGAKGSIATCNDTADDIRLVLDRLFAAEIRPTALITGRIGITLHLLPYLLNRGLRPPRDISIISRDDLPLLNYVQPAIARYSTTADKYARRLARMTLKFFDRSLPAVQQLIVPSFIRGQSVGPCPAAGELGETA